MTSKEFKIMNERRCFLISKEYRSELSSIEKIELEELQIKAGEYIRKKYPMDFSAINKILKKQKMK